MATKKDQEKYFAEIAPVIVKVAKERGYKFPSAVIIQGAVESAFNTSSLSKNYHNYFGLKCGSKWKGKSVNMKTKEEYTKGTLTTIKDNFRAYDSVEEGINGYFDFISTARYKNLKNATSPQEYFKLLKQDGYATSSTYVETLTNWWNKYDGGKYDEKTPEISGEILGKKETTIKDIPASTNKKVRVKTNGGNLNVRQTPSTKALIIGRLKNKTLIEVVGEEGEWYKINHGGTAGYIYKSYTEIV